MTEQQTAGNPAPDPRETEQEQAYPQEPEQSALEEERRKKKKRKKIALGAALAVLIGAVSGWYFLYYIVLLRNKYRIYKLVHPYMILSYHIS